jgi:hypothetical protein
MHPPPVTSAGDHRRMACSTMRSGADERVRAVAGRQGRVISRRQVLEAGLSDGWLARQVAARRWQRVHPGVYATHTGPLPYAGRCWAAVLYAGAGAALADVAAWQREAATPPGHTGDRITVAVDHARRVRPTSGVRIVRIQAMERLVHPARRPRCLRLEAALLLEASRARRADDAIGVLADACQQGRTTPRRLRDQLTTLPPSLRHRGVLQEVLDDVAQGAYSYLEVHYLRDVERPHGLPTGSRQRLVRAGRHRWFRDVEYVGFDVVAELDGRLGHEGFDDRAADMSRDNHAEAGRRRTVRIGYRHTMSQACETAVVVARILRQQGWRGRPRPCGPDCPVSESLGN